MADTIMNNEWGIFCLQVMTVVPLALNQFFTKNIENFTKT